MPGKLPWRSKGSPLQYSGLESSADCGVHGVAKGPPRLGDFDFDSSAGLVQSLQEYCTRWPFSMSIGQRA